MTNYDEDARFFENLKRQKEEEKCWPQKESATERYWREVKERQVGENTPDYDPWTGSYY